MPTKPDPATAVLEVEDLEVHYQLGGAAIARLLGLGGRTVKAVDGVNLTLTRGEVLGIVGESGSGKTTLGRALLGLAASTSGEITYHDRERGPRRISGMGRAELRHLRTDIQMVFQDPHAALNPTMTLETAIGHPLVIHGAARGAEVRRRVAAALEQVGLSPAEQYLGKYPSDLSGGQKQRAVIARAIIMEPEVLVADEPVSMLDMSVRAKILQLMIDLKEQLGLTYVYITHDLASAKYFCDRIAIMYLGRVVEIGSTEEIFANPRHPYTKALLGAIPEADPDHVVTRELPRGEIPDAARPPLGCSFHPRCPEATAICGWESRDLATTLERHWTTAPASLADEQAVLGKLGHLDKPSTTVTIAAGRAAEARALLDGIREADPGEPMWHGIENLEESPAGLRVQFHQAEEPALRRAGGVEVACVLYEPEPVTEQP